MSHERPRARFSLEQARKQAKELLAGLKAGERRAFELVRWNHPRLRKASAAEIRAHPYKLADAQLVIARTHHLESWARLKAHAALLERADSAESVFEHAADLVIAGDVGALRALLARHPALVTQRSTRAHRSTLLHFVAANGFEDYRQVTPANIVEVASLLLDAGADVNATSDAYGGDSTVLSLVATSAHPRLAGVQLALMDLLIDRGATREPIVPGGPWPRYSVANGCPEAGVHMVRRFATPETLYGAAGLGDLPALRRLFDRAAPEERMASLVLAAQCEQRAAALWLLGQGVPQRAHDGMTPLHWASAAGDAELVDALVRAGGDLEALNEYGGTVLSSTLWFAAHALPADLPRRRYDVMIDRLLALGARDDAWPELRDEIAATRARLARIRS
ncbi:MAG: hypothetical protein HY275_16450 [Gemmatimonadetes bacterium]|nr:hypothetical protein [Gemmatimonadota bacterium]